MKNLFLFHLIVFTISTGALAQNTDKGTEVSPTCFFVSHSAPKSNKSQISKTYCIGDKLKVTLKDGQIIKGTLDHISKDNILIVDGVEMDVSTIQSFERAGMSSGSAVIGTLLVVGGAALIISGNPTNLDLEEGPGKIVLGAGAMIGGFVVLVSRARFTTQEDDRWIYNH